MLKIEDQILKALKEKQIFIGIHMLCRYLNGRGYVRYGCNVGYEFPYSSNDKINPCPILCPNSKIYPSKLRYWIMKLAKEKELFTIKKRFHDSKNPGAKTMPMKTDLFRFVCESKEVFNKFWKRNTLEVFL